MPKTTRRRSNASAWLLELGVEELPVTAMVTALEQLRTVTPALLGAARLEHGAVHAFATPRRIGVLASDIAPRQRADVQELVGPPKSAAFDANNQPTQACLGFLKKWNARVEDVQLKETPRGTCIMVQRTLPALPATRALGEVTTTLLAKLQFPKTMRWTGSGEQVFARPLRWIVALYGAQVVPVAWGALRAGRASCASRNAGSKMLRVASAAQHAALLARQGIVIDPAARRVAVQRALERQLKPGERLAPECLAEGTSLLEEVADLVELPAAFRGCCDEKFAELPREILIASMAKYQRVFAVEDKQGKLLPAFIAVTNGKPGNPSAVRHVYETILGARLSDSLLFYRQDLTKSLEQHVPELKGILVHSKLLSMLRKSEKMSELTLLIAKQWNLSSQEQEQVKRAALLCKADLVTHVVYEFPSLQGTMGGIYYLQQHPTDRVIAEAIQDHYLVQRKIPRSIVGIITAIADRTYTLTGFLSAGIKPTGNADPFGLRRTANELLDLLVSAHSAGHSLSLKFLIEQTMAKWTGPDCPFPWHEHARTEAAYKEIVTYLKERFETRQDARYDLVRAVLTVRFDDAGDAVARIKALEACVRQEPKLFAQACKVSERTRNIVRAVKMTDTVAIDPAKLMEPLERDVWAAVERVGPQLTDAINHRRYTEALTTYARTFSDLLERFFTRVLVNAEDPAIRANRLALLKQVDQLISHSIADLTQVVLELTPASPISPTQEAIPA